VPPTVERMTDDRNDEQRKRPSWQLPQERQPESDAYHIWTPRPLLRSIYWKPDPPPPFETVSATYEIFLDQRAWLTMHEHVWQTGADRTPFGYLIGDLCEDPNANRRFVTITAALPARFDFRENAADQISREATLALQLEVERRRGVLAGWYHRHLGGEVAMGDNDIATHHKHFAEPWHCAFVFVVGGDRCEGGCFRSTPDAFAGDLLLPFYEMASNESLLARGVKRSYVDWSNYTTVDEIRSDPAPRRTIDLPAAPAGDEPGSELEAAAAPAPAKPEPDLVVEPLDTDPDLPSRAPPAEAPAPPARRTPAQAGGPRQEQEPEQASASEPDEAEPAEQLAPREAPEADVDFEAAIDAVRPARIELDLEASPRGPADPVDEVPAMTADEALAGAGLEPDRPAAATEGESRRAKPARKARPGVAARLAERKLPLAGGALLLVAIAAAALLFLRDGNGPGAEDGGSVDEAPIGAQSDAGLDGAAAVTSSQVDSAGQDLLGRISQFYGRAVARDDGDATCGDLAEALIAVENAWLSYSIDYKAKFAGPLPDRLAERDERLYAGVRDTERLFEQSQCPRP